jgi:hypothetical protein
LSDKICAIPYAFRLPKCPIRFEFTPFAIGFSRLVISELAISIESIDCSVEATWMTCVVLAFGQAQDPIIVICTVLTGICEPVKALLEASELYESGEAGQALLNIVKK